MSTGKAGRTVCTVRELREDDRAQWETLYRGYAGFYDVPMTDEILRATWGWLMSPQHPEEARVAESASGVLAGLAHFRAFPKPLLGRDAGFLDDLFVDPSQRGNGVGRALIKAVCDIARERGWPQVRWITARDNAVARGLYDQLTPPARWVTYDLAPGEGRSS